MRQQIDKEAIAVDQGLVLASRRRFFAARLLQQRMQSNGERDPRIIARLPTGTRSFPHDASDAEIAEFQRDLEWRCYPGNLFLEH